MFDVLFKLARYIQCFISYLGGRADAPPTGLPLSPYVAAWGVWWGILLLIILIFCGQGSKFIYIDF